MFSFEVLLVELLSGLFLLFVVSRLVSVAVFHLGQFGTKLFSTRDRGGFVSLNLYQLVFGFLGFTSCIFLVFYSCTICIS